MTPICHFCEDVEGLPVVELAIGDRGINFYANGDIIRHWGTSVLTEMDDGANLTFLELWSWLTETVP